MNTKNKIALTIIAALSGSISGCSSTNNPPLQPELVQQISTTSESTLFDASSPLLTVAHFQQASAALATTTEFNSLDKLLYYFRAFSYYGPIEQLEATDYAGLSVALEQLASSGQLNNQARLQEQYAVTVYRYFSSNERAVQLAPLLPQLNTQLAQLASTASLQSNDYALLETLKAYGFLFNVSRKEIDGELNATLLSAQLNEPLVSFAASDASIRADKDWPRTNAYWALALYRLSLPSSEDGETTALEKAVDEAVANIAKQDVAKRGESAKDAYSKGYHVNTFAAQERCQENSEICRIPELKEALPIEHRCSDSLFILAQDLNQQELTDSCTKLTSQESHFHQLLETQQQPTANDNNDALRVVAFKNWSQYHYYGQLVFDIQTDNGGMYIEGKPSKPGNQATFFAYRQWWIEPEFAIWNLNHEYVHYLDGHFVKYGGFGHFPSKMVWWSEGLAEYIARGDQNPTTLKIIKRDIEEAPSLEDIFATEYKDGVDMTYKWSYMAVRFLAEHHHSDYVKLSQFLKTDYFEGYESLLAELTQHQQEFAGWLAAQVEQFDDSEEKAKPRLHKQNRYAYRDYLQPEHLTQDSKHLHF
ncbi:collagenase [Shewanella sp. Choline-02u-19]|uniref:collagenase n=1 Tax=unclassified Shewanella TaxID=196818 RepID=UPI000C332B08|nr:MULTISPECIES: collagenase [unclassified Shewanella]PKH63230.1 collagenase [Shewanella sp. Bg11-22]PKI30750.1 collagenase [Shewanella sp. Choline-02u-19]